jgi:hypothetical protein
MQTSQIDLVQNPQLAKYLPVLEVRVVCEGCSKGCEPILSMARQESSEWYCAKCHRSYDMSEEDFQRYAPAYLARLRASAPQG